MKYGIILAAGKQTRFKSNIPKALYPYKDSTVLQHNIEIMENYVDKIFVVTSFDNREFFENLEICKKCEIHSIHSGFGCGDAVYKSLTELTEINAEDDVILIWGDSIQQHHTYEQMIAEYNYDFVVPVVLEPKPYVEFDVFDSGKLSNIGKIASVRFSKYNDNISDNGYHDLSIFMFEKEKCLFGLQKLRHIWKTEESYKEKRNGEMIFLDIFNWADYSVFTAQTVDIFDIEDKSFNTLEEYSKLANN